MNLKNKTKAELIEIIESLQDEIPSYDQLNERYDQGFDAGYYQGKEDSIPVPLGDEDLEEYPNVVRFG